MTDPHLATPSGLPRARSIPVPFEGTPGPFNAITDVTGLEVGYQTLISGEGPLKVGEGPVRTGVTAILPRGRSLTPVFAAFHSFNGNGELSGCHWIEESGLLEGPITITNTHSCGIARDATVGWMRSRFPDQEHDLWGLPVAGETYDGDLNDIDGFHVTAADVEAALDAAAGGPIELGSVGGGTGMIAYEFKGGSGSASRLVDLTGKTYALGAFVQANYGRRRELTIAGVPVGRHLTGGEVKSPPGGSVIAVVATDAPLLPHQLKRLAFMAKKTREILKASRIERIFEESGGYDRFNSTHVFGTCRMGVDPANSVVDPFCRSHRWRNLFIVDASVFPSSGGGESPSLTIEALGIRTGDYIRDALKSGDL